MGYREEVLADSPAGYWRLGEPSGLPQDSSGNGRHVTAVVGVPTYGVAGAVGDGTTAVGFDGASAFTIPDAVGLDFGSTFSLEAWVIRGAIGADRGIVSKGSQSYYLRINATGKLNLLASNKAEISESAGVLPASGWHHVVGTVNGGTGKVYIDGVDVTVTLGSPIVNDNATALAIGGDLAGTAEQFNGSIDEVAVYPTVLSPARVAAHYAAAMASGSGQLRRLLLKVR